MDKRLLPDVKGEYRFNYDLKHLTWFKTGGKAEVFFRPYNLSDLQFFLKNLDSNVPVNIIGNCSNIIIRDGGVDGIVIKLGKNFANITKTGDIITAGAASLNSSITSFAIINNAGGLEFLSGIPGSVGGGIKMNSGCYGKEFKDVLESFSAIDRKGDLHKFKSSANIFEYRKCLLDDDLIFVEASFKTEFQDSGIIKEQIEELQLARSKTQPIKEKTSGSSFANPQGASAWKLIDNAGLRGYKIGGATFSPLHCNFLINTGDATSYDLEELGELAIKRVYEHSGIRLNWEIKRIGKYE
ncbi:MAG: UDP-N-acetylmuramate dehydrogenase [Rickettsiaceae bacterium]|nr:UDP-N-acetylmuramate dehydrogenase [Rickettsiaceae bacterium]